MPHLKIIRASAGSGKTFSLTQEYLRLLFAERDNFMHILAVTFTNKATEEMKSRIIRELYQLSANQPSKQLEGLMNSTGLAEIQVREKAKTILKRLLHHYSGFSVSTIDSFFQRIIRGFTRELGIQGGYSIELDTDAILTWIINRLLIRAETDPSLLSWLTKFAESLIEKGESWDLKKGIRALGSEIFREEFRSFEEVVIRKFSDRSFLKSYQTELYVLRTRIGNEYRDFGRSARTILESHGLTVDDFNSKSRGPAGFLVKLETGDFRGPTNTAIQAASGLEKWYTANSPIREQIMAVAGSELLPLMQQVVSYYSEHGRTYYSAGAILKNLYTLGILSDLSYLADLWCNENNAFLLSEAPVFLNRIIGGNDTPFIYEKAGCWFHHFMIDEFQDTSLLQWSNFKPLISNSLSQDYDNLTVGDVKQSIYRWRNSNWEILENIIHDDFLPGITYPVTLNKNWRSKANIISFNNRFFTSAAEILQEVYIQNKQDQGHGAPDLNVTDITSLYKNVHQEPGDALNTGGYVQVEFLEGDDEHDFSDTVHHKIIGLLQKLQDSGYHLNDIAILTRKNREAKQIADFLLQYANEHPDPAYRFDVISDEALRLGSSTPVVFLVTLLRHLENPADLTNKYMLQWILDTYISPGEQIAEWENPGFSETVGVFSLTEILERLIAIFHLEKFTGERVYLQAFRDMVIDYSRKNSSEISRFLEYWQDTGKEKSISAPAGQDALRILTIHKSKGLEFKITIIPYCSWELHSPNGSFLWCQPQQEPFNKLELIPLVFSSQLKETIFAGDYFREYQRQLIDNLNLLYVAFTRARDGLFVMCKAHDTDQVRNVSDLTRKVLGRATYTMGTLLAESPAVISSSQASFNVSPIPLSVISDRIRIAVQGKLIIDPAVGQPSRPLNEGKLLHEIFKMINGPGDVTSAIDRLHLQGIITGAERGKYTQLITDAISDPQVSSWYTDEWRILSEAEIILPAGEIRRPDRVMIRDGKTLVIDYKFGNIMETVHETQIKEYANLLHAMGYENIEACLWYVKLGRFKFFSIHDGIRLGTSSQI